MFSYNLQILCSTKDDEESHIQRRILIAIQRKRKAEEEQVKLEKERIIEEEPEVTQKI